MSILLINGLSTHLHIAIKLIVMYTKSFIHLPIVILSDRTIDASQSANTSHIICLIIGVFVVGVRVVGVCT